MADRLGATLDSLHGGNTTGLHRKNRRLVNRGSHRLHQEKGQNERQTDQGLISRGGLKAESLSQEVEDHQQPRKRSQAEQQRGDQRQEGEQDDDRPRDRVSTT